MSVRRLILCLDGTWNQEDDSTNVLHHFNLVQESDVQKKKYFRGVGTGPLDRLTGGGFGLGLEENVREAYNWLVQNYRDGEDPYWADEIYIFGFSRGAYTARSLVGFISRCGLLRKGAPFTVNELWKDYGYLQREHENRSPSPWAAVFGDDRPESPLHDITKLKCDPWLTGEKRRKMEERLITDLNAREQRFLDSSRRVRITYLGVYDTVGAIGLDAFAIPGLRSRLASHHNMRPTTIIQKCRHALALDEHRSSFRHTPFLAFLGPGTNQEQDRGGTSTDEDQAAENEDDRLRMWTDKIDQCWFAGAHSNIGGGYPDNVLAQEPLEWILKGAQLQGLQCDAFTPVEFGRRSPKDSYAEFAQPFWALLIREKRFYRRIDLKPERRASAGGGEGKGFLLRDIHEYVAPTITARYEEEYPPNLYEYYRRQGDSSLREPQPDWLRGGAADWTILILWSLAAVAGLEGVSQLFSGTQFPWWTGALGFIFPLIDWGESGMNFRLTLRGYQPKLQALRDSLYWLRGFSFVLVAVGALSIAGDCFRWGWQWHLEPNSLLLAAISAISASFGIVIAKQIDKWPAALKQRHVSWKWPGVAAISLASLVILGLLAQRLVPGLPAGVRWFADNAWGTHGVGGWNKAGYLLLLELAFALCANAFFVWVGRPMRTANLGSITKLQRCKTYADVGRQLSDWTNLLASGTNATDIGDAAPSMRAIVREALWRDIWGFIPLYTCVLGFGLWFGATQLSWKLFNNFSAAWLLILAVGPLANWAEDICLLTDLRCEESKQPLPALLPNVAFALMCVTVLAFAVAALGTAAAIVTGNVEVIREGVNAGWRGAVVTLLALAVVVVALLLVAGLLKQRFKGKRHDDPPPPDHAKVLAASAGGTGANPS